MNEGSEPTTGSVEPMAGGDWMDSATEAIETFHAHRNLLFTVAQERLWRSLCA
ncbi:hypothetical protein [Nonomuraea sp. NPDC049400]|uniref:hypothetical protein n=1 Tax=Nonomuraea sp. NPDC049400 TaxID=3364352 RepID=UPI00378757AA